MHNISLLKKTRTLNIIFKIYSDIVIFFDISLDQPLYNHQRFILFIIIFIYNNCIQLSLIPSFDSQSYFLLY